MEGNGRIYGRWWSRRGLLLAGTAVLGFRLGLLGLRCTLRHIDDDLNLIVRVVCFCGIARRGHATSLFAWASRGCVYITSFTLSARRYRRVIVIPARGRLGTRVRGRFVRDVTTTSTLPLSLRLRTCVPPPVVECCHWPRVALEPALRLTPFRLRFDSPVERERGSQRLAG